MNIQYGKGSGTYIYTDDQGNTLEVARDIRNRYFNDIQSHISTGYQVSVCDPEPDNGITHIKAEAQRRIITWTVTGTSVESHIYWRERQSNFIARSLELQTKKIDGNSWTPTETAEFAAISGFWDRVKAIRGDSNLLENKYNSGQVNQTGIYSSQHWHF